MFKKPLLLFGILLTTLFLLVFGGIFTSHAINSGVKISAGRTAIIHQPKTPVSNKLNINTASADALTQLPGIGPVLAERIVEYRTKNGPFKSIQELTEVKGIGEKTLDTFKEYITIGD